MLLYRNFFPLPPLVDDGSPGNRTPQKCSGTGTTESQTKRALIKGKVHILYVGAAGVRVRFSGDPNLGAGAVDPARDVTYGPWNVVPFVPEDHGTVGSTYVYVEAADGVSAYEATVVQIQP